MYCMWQNSSSLMRRAPYILEVRYDLKSKVNEVWRNVANSNFDTAPQQTGGRHFGGPSNKPGGPNNQKPQNNVAKIISIVALVLGVILLIVAGIFFFNDWQSSKRAEDATNEAREAVVTPSVTPTETTNESQAPEAAQTGNAGIPVVDWEKLHAINKDIVGWLQIPGTNVNYPVVQGASNNDYLRTTIRGDKAVEGSIFMDYESSRSLDDLHTILYGHNIKNGSMFHAIASYSDKDFFNQHRTAYYITPEKNVVLKALATYVTDGADMSVRKFDFANEQEFTDYVKDRISKSAVVADDFDVANVKHLFELSTCSYMREDGRTILLLAPDPKANTEANKNGIPVNNQEGQMVPQGQAA